MSVCCLVDGQFGSTGKGLVAGQIARDYDIHVRVGAANAGHTLYTPGDLAGGPHGPVQAPWEKHVLQQLPCAAYAHPQARLYIGPGALISPEILVAEHWENHRWRVSRGLPPAEVVIDWRAHLIHDLHKQREAESDLQERIGSTSATAREGIGQAQADRVMRRADCVTMGQMDERGAYAGFNPEAADLLRAHFPEATGLDPPAMLVDDVPELLWRRGKSGSADILLEGAQGAGLSLTTGQFPYVTSRNTTAAGLAADCGIGPRDIDRVILVVRTYPIRVAGNSGPFWPDSEEITWDALGVDPESERTTVTRKVRRVATFSLDQVRYAARLNSATEIALTFTDYVDPTIAGRSGVVDEDLDRNLGTDHPKVWSLVSGIEAVTGVPVTFLGTGPHSVVTLDPRLSSIKRPVRAGV